MRKEVRKQEHFAKVNIRYAPDDENSESYQLLIYKHANGGPTEFIEFYRAYLQCKQGQNLTLGAACCRLAESLLRGALVAYSRGIPVGIPGESPISVFFGEYQRSRAFVPQDSRFPFVPVAFP